MKPNSSFVKKMRFKGLCLSFLAIFSSSITQAIAGDCFIVEVNPYTDFKNDKTGALTQSVFVDIIVASDLPRQATLSALKGLAIEAVNETGAHHVDIRQFSDLDTAFTSGKMHDLSIRYHPDTERFAFANSKWVIFDTIGYETGKPFTKADLENSRPTNRCEPL